MKKIMFFLFSLTLYVNILQGAVPFSHDQQVPILPELPSPAIDDQVPNLLGHQIRLPRNVSLPIYRAFISLPDGFISLKIKEKIDQILPRANSIIIHGHNTGQLRLFKKNKELIAIREALAIQLLQLNIFGVDDEGRLDPRLTVLDDFFVENLNAHQIRPFEEDDSQIVPKQRQPLCHRLLYN